MRGRRGAETQGRRGRRGAEGAEGAGTQGAGAQGRRGAEARKAGAGEEGFIQIALGRGLGRLEGGRAVLLERLGTLSPGQLTARPAAGGWHVLDVVQHVIIVEELVLRAVGTRPGPLPLAERIRSGLRLTALRVYLRAGGRVRAPTPAILPQGSVPLDELRARWDRVRAGYASALDSFGPADMTRPMMKHPIVGKLTPKQTLTFLDTHLAHHGRQIERILGAVRR